MPDYRFAEMKEDYLDDVLKIYSHYVLNTTASFHTRQPTREEMRELVFFENDRYKTFVLLDGQELCGYVFLAQHKKREAYDATAEVSVYLKPCHIGKGLGSLCLRHIEAYALTRNLHVLIATICGQNEASLGLFTSNGYEKCAHYKEVGEKFGQWLDIVACQKILC